ncbi:MAG: hypothetical protein KDC10_14055 [Calditrichaeota bacterium]|nr:hypothetical protein [Calditrichota bacterium]
MDLHELASGLRELTVELRGLVREVKRDRESIEAWQLKIEADVKEIRGMLLNPPDGLTHQVAANTADRRERRFWRRVIGAAFVGQFVVVVVGLVMLWPKLNALLAAAGHCGLI